MTQFQIRLLGTFKVSHNGHPLPGFESSRVQELFTYLLLYRSQRHSREVLSSVLWADMPTQTSRKNLRQTLWLLREAIEPYVESSDTAIFCFDADHVEVHVPGRIWVDVGVLEETYCQVQGASGKSLTSDQAAAMQAAVDLYSGDLLIGCYQDWCIFERERLQNVYLAMLDKLMAYSTTNGQYEQGISYGGRILSHDAAHERTHARLMRLHYLAGDRSAALRQYQMCVAALREELDVYPGARTVALFEQIRSDQLAEDTIVGNDSLYVNHIRLAAVLHSLEQLSVTLDNVRHLVESEIHTVTSMMGLRE